MAAVAVGRGEPVTLMGTPPPPPSPAVAKGDPQNSHGGGRGRRRSRTVVKVLAPLRRRRHSPARSVLRPLCNLLPRLLRLRFLPGNE